MTAKPLPRPRQVSFSGWSIVAGSVLTILFAFQRVAELGSIEAQQSALDFVSTAPGDGLGLSVDEVQTAIRIMCLVAGGTAAATAILGWQAMQPSRSARVVLSVLAPILFIAGLTSGGLFSALVAAGVVMLWAQPARDFFDGKAPQRDQSIVQAMSGRSDTPAPPSAASSWDLAPPTDHTTQGVPVPPGPTGGQHRPGRITAAAVTTIVASGVTLAGLMVSLLFILSNRDDFIDQINDEMAGNAAYDGLSADAIADVSLGFLIVLAIWCVVAIGLAVATMRGRNGARIGLVVSASLSALVSLLGALVIVPLVLTIASIVTVVLLVTGGAGDWFDARSQQR